MNVTDKETLKIEPKQILEGLVKFFFGERAWKNFQRGKIGGGGRNIRKRIF